MSIKLYKKKKGFFSRTKEVPFFKVGLDDIIEKTKSGLLSWEDTKEILEKTLLQIDIFFRNSFAEFMCNYLDTRDEITKYNEIISKYSSEEELKKGEDDNIIELSKTSIDMGLGLVKLFPSLMATYLCILTTAFVKIDEFNDNCPDKSLCIEHPVVHLQEEDKYIINTDPDELVCRYPDIFKELDFESIPEREKNDERWSLYYNNFKGRAYTFAASLYLDEKEEPNWCDKNFLAKTLVNPKTLKVNSKHMPEKYSYILKNVPELKVKKIGE